MSHNFLLHTFYLMVFLAFLMFQKRRIDQEKAAIEQLKNELNGESK